MGYTAQDSGTITSFRERFKQVVTQNPVKAFRKRVTVKIVLLFIILLIGLYLRFNHIDKSVFVGDAAREVAAAYLIVNKLASCYLPGPAYYYLLSSASLFSACILI
jgi:hypothetical protein